VNILILFDTCMTNWIKAYIKLDPIFLKDQSIINTLTDLGFKPTQHKPNLFLKVCTDYNLDEIHKYVSFFYYKGKRCFTHKNKNFDSYINSKLGRSEFQLHCNEYNEFCGYA